MKREIAALSLAMFAGAASADVTVGVDDSTAPWLGFMNVFNLPAPDGDGAYQFGSPWGVPDLTANFNDGAGTLTLGPNTIGDPDPYWYIGGGGPGAAGNKIMEANLYQELTGVINGEVVNFEGVVLSDTFTSAHQATIFIRDFAPDFSSVVEVSVPLDAGAFSLSLATINDPARHIQWGFQVKGVNVWATDVAPFGNAVIAQIPAPASAALLGLGGLVAARRRR